MQTGKSSRGEWQKQDFILETQDQYPKKVCISVWNNKIELEPHLNGLVKVFINIESREYNERWYTDVKAWKLESLTNSGNAQEVPPPEYMDMDMGNNVDQNPGNEEELDDLPF